MADKYTGGGGHGEGGYRREVDGRFRIMSHLTLLNVDSMLGQRHGRWPNIEPKLGECESRQSSITDILTSFVYSSFTLIKIGSTM